MRPTAMRMVQRLSSVSLVLAYLLVLVTNIPHLYYVYADYEQGARGWAIGMALAFDLSLGIFTYRRIKIGRAQWRDRGIKFFIVSSILANMTYYYGGFWNYITPAFLAVAIPVSLALFAEEFGLDVKREERRPVEGPTYRIVTPELVEPAKSYKEQVWELLDMGTELTNQQIAERLGCSQSTVSRARQGWRQGERIHTD